MTAVKILIVEDEAIESMDLQQRLSGLGYPLPDIAYSGEEGIAKVEKIRPDLVLMDIMMPGKFDGIAAAEQIRSRFDIPVIFLTAYADENTLRRAKITAPYGYIIKPFQERELHITVDMALFRHKMERELRGREKWLSTTLRSIGDGVIATDEKGLITFINPVAEALTGFGLEEAHQRDLAEVFHIVNRDTRQLTENPVAKVIREGRTVGLANHTVLISRDGREIPINDSAAPIKDDLGNLLGVILVFSDVTEREKFEYALGKAHAELELRVQERTRELKEAEQSLREINETLEQRVAARTSELRAANETLRASRVAALNLMEDAITARAETEERAKALHQSEARLKQANAHLGEINRELESFIYSASHDLRAPLRSISGFAEMVKRIYSGSLDEKGNEYLTRIVNGAGRMTRIIDDLLHLSRVSRQDMVRVWVDMSKKASAIIAELRDSDPVRNVNISIAGGLTAFADPRLIEVALSNLIGNAWKFTSKTENACIEFGAMEKDGKTVFYVKDNGAGFDPKYSQKMFWPFHRLHVVSQFEGTGIGLAIVERVIRRHGGKVWAEGQVGKGAVLYFTLED